nr:immunoglobulin heavy chain junction region [Macaca mulatta]
CAGDSYGRGFDSW